MTKLNDKQAQDIRLALHQSKICLMINDIDSESKEEAIRSIRNAQTALKDSIKKSNPASHRYQRTLRNNPTH